MTNKTLKRRFAVALAAYTLLVFCLWFAYHSIVLGQIDRQARENSRFAANALLSHLDGEFSRLKILSSAIAGSESVQGFLQQADVAAYYERAGDAAEIIGKIAYQATDLDSIVTFTPQGAWYRFTGGISNAACRQLWAAHKQGTLAAYAVIELDGVWFFCHAAPVYTDTAAKPVGTVVLLDTLQKTLRALEGNVSGIDTAVILDDTILLSDNPALEGQNAQTLVGQYGEVTMSQVSGTNLSVAAAVTKEALNTGGRTFLAVSAALLVFLALAIALLYRFLSSRMIVPLLTKAEKMQMGLLTTQIDAHFVVNTITTIQILSEKGESDRAARLSGGLAALIKCQHQAGDSVNIFMELEMLEQYAEVMNARRENRYNVDFEVDDRLAACRMPGQVLQPVVENAMLHAFAEKQADCRITIGGTLEGGVVCITVADNGAGMAPRVLAALRAKLEAAENSDFPEQGLTGVALLNIQKRLRLRYGKRAGLMVESTPGQGTTVTLCFPEEADS
ncbi:MAG: histidine kinase [Ruminococcaceae bacterium]|nr:histidine kinase [Oscillospiraceae bacterium]